MVLDINKKDLKPKVDLPREGEISICSHCGLSQKVENVFQDGDYIDEYINIYGYSGVLVDTGGPIQLCGDCLQNYEEINKVGELYVSHKDVSVDDCSFDVYEHDNFIILLEYDKERENQFTIQYNLLNDDFNSLFIRKYWTDNDYCINEWTTTEFNTNEEMIEFLKKIGLKQL